MKSKMKAGLLLLVAYGFWIYILWGITDAFGIGLVGAILGAIIATACVLFGIYGLKNALVRDLNAKPASTGIYADLNRQIANLAYKEGFPKPELYMLNEHAPHAASVGITMKNAAIFVTKGLVETLNEDELCAYVTHELAHIKRGDHLAADIGAGIAYVILYPTRMFDGINDGENIPKLLSLLIFGPFAAIFVQLAAYRALDYDADFMAADIHGQGFSLASALNSGQKDVRKHPIKVPHYCAHLFTVEAVATGTQAGALFVTHVPTPKRIARLKRLGLKTCKALVQKNKGIT
jgi:heat shock protein HtpX